MCDDDSNIHEMQDDIQSAIDAIEKETYNKNSFVQSEKQERLGWRIFEAAKAIGRYRLSDAKEYDPDWFDDLSDYDVFCFAMCPGADRYADLLHPSDYDYPGGRLLLPGVTPADREKRKARLLAVLKAQLAPPSA